jgi:trk system potassium uptake protein TrkH
MGTFNQMSSLAKWWSSFLMIVGRLELFTVLIIFTAYFWKKR